MVNQQTEVPDWPGVWALGDCAAIKQVDGQMSPPTAQHALRQAKTCAQNIVASFRGTPKKIFAFTGLGKLGSLGRRSAVAEMFGIHLKGLIAWLFWRGVYVTKFPGLDGQVRLIADWFLDTFLPRDITQLRLFHEQDVHREHFEPGETVFGSGDFGDKIYFLVKGEVTVERNGATLATLRDGDVFGEAALISDLPRNATIRATTSVDAIAVSRERFPGIARALARTERNNGEDHGKTTRTSCRPRAGDAERPATRRSRTGQSLANAAANMPESSAGAVRSHANLNMVRRLVIPLFLLTLVASSGAGEKKKPGIEWREWSDEIFAQAEKQNRFVLLDLGAVWCHWCHVMEEITYRDPKVIALIKQRYIAVRVDQDSRPDLVESVRRLRLARDSRV